MASKGSVTACSFEKRARANSRSWRLVPNGLCRRPVRDPQKAPEGEQVEEGYFRSVAGGNPSHGFHMDRMKRKEAGGGKGRKAVPEQSTQLT